MFMKLFNIILLTLFISVNSFADVITNLSVSGNKRISKESIAVFGDIKLNQEYDSNDLNKILKNLYETNFFENLKINIENETLYIEIVENPIIEHIYIDGVKNKKFKEYLLSSLNLKSRNSYIKSIFENDITSISNTLKQSGYYFSEVEPIIEKNDEQNRFYQLGKDGKCYLMEKARNGTVDIVSMVPEFSCR